MSCFLETSEHPENPQKPHENHPKKYFLHIYFKNYKYARTHFEKMQIHEKNVLDKSITST